MLIDSTRSRWLIASLVLLLAAGAGAAPATAGSATAAPATPAAASGTCGNGVLDGTEACETCADDCRVTTCAPGARRTATIDLTLAQGYTDVTTVGLLIPYRSAALAIPGERDASSVKARFTARQRGTKLVVNDLGYGVRISASNGDGMTAGPLFDVAFDVCEGAAAPRPDDVTCRVLSCARGGGGVTACTCAATVR